MQALSDGEETKDVADKLRLGKPLGLDKILPEHSVTESKKGELKSEKGELKSKKVISQGF